MNKTMKQITLLILITSSLFISCSTNSDNKTKSVPVSVYSSPIDFSESDFQAMLNTYPVNGTPRFFASVIRKSRREDELPAALLQASEQASKYIAVKAVSQFYTERINSSMRYIRNLEVVWDRGLALDMIDRLSLIAVFKDTYGTYIIAELADENLPAIPYSTKWKNGKPEWTNVIPEIPGYMVSVGISLQAGYVAESFTASDNQALEDLARQISVDIVTGKRQIENAIGTASIQQNLETSKVVIPGFYILDRWRTPNGRYYYSLGVAPELK
ncbi:MAG: LPP20 family lipoprotein [Spirochaetales bacterium]|nr:LPP20 family lipoprotein [Spirochaetales bacterium]